MVKIVVRFFFIEQMSNITTKIQKINISPTLMLQVRQNSEKKKKKIVQRFFVKRKFQSSRWRLSLSREKNFLNTRLNSQNFLPREDFVQFI